VNDLDYGALLDVRLTLYYKARYDPDLKNQLKAVSYEPISATVKLCRTQPVAETLIHRRQHNGVAAASVEIVR
jgi:hypothetical protein